MVFHLGMTRFIKKLLIWPHLGGMVFLTNTDKDKLLEDINEIKRIEEFEVEKIFDIR